MRRVLSKELIILCHKIIHKNNHGPTKELEIPRKEVVHKTINLDLVMFD